MGRLKADGALNFEIDGTQVSLTEEDLLISVTTKEGFVTEGNSNTTVVLDTNLTPELIEEGFVLEVISKIQTMRKDSDFEVMDRIKVAINGNDKLADVVLKNRDAIATKVLADEILKDHDFEISKDWNINGEKAQISLQRV